MVSIFSIWCPIRSGETASSFCVGYRKNEAITIDDDALNSTLHKIGYDDIALENIAYWAMELLNMHRTSQVNSLYPNGTKTFESFIQFAISSAHTSTAQLFQDLWVLFELGEKHSGYFVEFGATNGVSLSNTLLLEKFYSWRGILVEPNPAYQLDLQKNRNCEIDFRCVYSETGKTLDLRCTESGEFSRLADVNPMDGHEATYRDKYEVTSVESVRLNDLLDDYNAPDEIDYISIDTEGSEFEILNSFDFTKRQVRAFTIEHNFTPMKDRIFELLTANGYTRRFASFTRFDNWYIHNSV